MLILQLNDGIGARLSPRSHSQALKLLGDSQPFGYQAQSKVSMG